MIEYLVLLIILMVVFSVVMTGVHIIKPGQIGFLYRGSKFLGHTGPAFVFVPPIIGKVYRMKMESFHVAVEASAIEIEVLLGISEPARVPVTDKCIGSEIRNTASKTINEVAMRNKPTSICTEPDVVADQIRSKLNESFKNMGLRVDAVRVGDHDFNFPIDELAGAKISSWDEVAHRFGY